MYCQDEDCEASPDAAMRLVAAGYTDVMDFEGGKDAWARSRHRLTREEAGQRVVQDP